MNKININTIDFNGGSAAWGSISGDLSNQTDLSNSLENLQDQITDLKGIGRFLSLWDASEGLPLSEPSELPYTYKTGDYFRVKIVSEDFAGYKGKCVFAGYDYLDITAEIEFPDGTPIPHKSFYNWLINNGYDSKEGTLYPASGIVNAYVNGSITDSFTVVGLCAEDEYTNPYGLTKNVTIITDDSICDHFYFWEDDDHTLHLACPDGTAGTEARFSTGINYKPDGSEYTGAASTVEETEKINIGSVYYYDGSLWLLSQGGGSSTSDYRDLDYKPQINGFILEGDKSSEDLGLGTKEQEKVTAEALNELWEKLLSEVRISLLREDIVDSYEVPHSSKPVSAKAAYLLNNKFAELELIIASSLNDLNEAKAILESLAPRYSGNKLYSVGDFCTEYGKLWKCDVAYTVLEPTFDASKWHTTTITEEFITTN